MFCEDFFGSGTRTDVLKRSLTFRAQIPDEKLRELVAPGEIVEIVRGSWISHIVFYSDEHESDIDLRIKTWFENWKEEATKRHEAEWQERHRIWQAKNDPFPRQHLPATRSVFGKGNVQGYCYLDDDDKWVYVFPEE